jgi:hypothetical protein
MRIPKPGPMAVYFVLAFLLMLPLLGAGYYVSLDMQMGPNSFSDFQFGDLYGYFQSPYGAYLPVYLALAALSKALPVEVLEKGLLFLVLFLCGACAHRSLPEKLGNSRYFAGFLYMLNPFVFVRFLAGHWALLLSYAVWPLAIKLFSDFLDKPEERGRLAGAALITMFASVSSEGVLILLLCYAALFVRHAVRKGVQAALLRSSALLAIIVLAMNLFWIVPMVLTFGQAYTPTSTSAYLADFGASGGGMPVDLAVLTMHGFWKGGFTLTKDVFSLWYVPYAAIALLSLVGLAFLFRSAPDDAVFMLFLLAAGLVLSTALGAQVLALLGADRLVYFVFRDSQKFVGLIALAYSGLGAYGAYHIARFIPLADRYKKLIPLLLLVIPLAYNYGFFGFLGQVGPTLYPKGWALADSIIAADPIQANILVLPPHLYMPYRWINSTQKTAGLPAFGFFSKPVITSFNLETKHVYADTTDPYGQYLSWLFYNRRSISNTGNTAEMLLPLEARYVILFKNSLESFQYLPLFERKGGVPGIKLVFEDNEMLLFRDDLVTGPFFASTENGSGGFGSLLNHSNIYSANVSYEEITPASFHIQASPYPYVVFMSSQPSLIWAGNATASSWHGVASAFTFNGPMIVANWMFYLTLTLFLLFWMIVLILILGNATAKEAAIFTVSAVAVYLLTTAGLLSPHLIGALFLASLCAVVFLRFRQP